MTRSRQWLLEVFALLSSGLELQRTSFFVFRIILVCSTLASLTGCGDAANGGYLYPPELTKSALLFREAALSNRWDKAVLLLGNLPKCPELSRQTTGPSTFITYDYSRPSYFLTMPTLLSLAGEPYSRTADSCSYVIATSKGGIPSWVLLVFFQDGHVVKASIISAAP